MLFELFTGRLLFDTHHDDEHLKLIERALGAFPASFAPTAPRHFREDGTLMWNAHTASKVEGHGREQYLAVFLLSFWSRAVFFLLMVASSLMFFS